MVDVSPRHRLQQEIEVIAPTLQLLAKAFCKYPTDANRLLRETKASAIARNDHIEEGTPLKPWLFAIMHETFRRNGVSEKVPNRDD